RHGVPTCPDSCPRDPRGGPHHALPVLGRRDRGLRVLPSTARSAGRASRMGGCRRGTRSWRTSCAAHGASATRPVRACPPTAGRAACRGCAARRSRSSPGCRPTTTRLEQGRRITPSPAVVDAIGRALALDAAGRAHLADLVGLGTATPQRRARPVQRLRPGLYQLLDALADVPVLVLGRRAHVPAPNRLGRPPFTDLERFPAPRRNYARWMLLDDEARSLFVDWEEQARVAVENLRLEAGNDPADRATADLVAELRETSDDFARWWDEHRVNQRT